MSKREHISLENAISIGKEYTHRSVLRDKEYCVYQILKKNNILDDVIPLKIQPITYEKAYNTAKKYKSYTQFREENHTIYVKSFKKGWINDFIWLEKNVIDNMTKEHIVYVYEFPQYKSFYVGRTKRPQKRHKQHLNDENDSVFKFAKLKKISIIDADYKVLKENLNSSESQFYENYYLDLYVKKGWKPINKVKTGSLGGNFVIWDKKTCYNEALKYSNETDFLRNCKGGYVKSKKMGWDKEYTWLKKYDPHVYHTYEECYEKAKLYNTLNDFARNDSSYYRYSKKNDYLSKFIWFYKKEKYDNIIEYDLEGNFIKEYQNNEIKQPKRQGILSCAMGKRRFSYNRIWVFRGDALDNNKKIKTKINGINGKYQPISKEIVEYDKDGNFVKEHKSIASAANEIGCTITSLCDALKGDKTIYCYNRGWKYKSDVLDENGNIEKKITFRPNKKKRKIIQYDIKGNVIHTYSSLTEVYKKYSRYSVDWTLKELWKKRKINKNEYYFNYKWCYEN